MSPFLIFKQTHSFCFHFCNPLGLQSFKIVVIEKIYLSLILLKNFLLCGSLLCKNFSLVVPDSGVQSRFEGTDLAFILQFLESWPDDKIIKMISYKANFPCSSQKVL